MRKHFLAGQISALEHVIDGGGLLRFDDKGVQICRHRQQLDAALETLKFVHRHEAEFTAFLAARKGGQI